MLIDTHCHLIDDYIAPGEAPAVACGIRAGIIQRARNAGVGAIVVPCADPGDPPRVLALCEQYDNLFATVGIHPEFAGNLSPHQNTPHFDSPQGGSNLVLACSESNECLTTPPLGGVGAGIAPVGGQIVLNYEKYLSHPRVVGIGEIGLDYHYDSAFASNVANAGREPPSRAAQIELFRAQLEIACNAGLPVAIHTRDAESDTFEILKNFSISAPSRLPPLGGECPRSGRGGASSKSNNIFKKDISNKDGSNEVAPPRLAMLATPPHRGPRATGCVAWGGHEGGDVTEPRAIIPGVMHCYSSSWNLAKKMLDRGFYFSASGIITFKNAEELREIFRRLPIDRIVIETDAPFLAPVPYRGKPAEPFMIAETARVLADIRDIPLAELEQILMENTKRLYPKLVVGDSCW